MLDRIGNGNALRVLADASESLGIQGRRDARKYTSLVPLNRFVDAVPPESPVVRHLTQMAEQVTSDPGAQKAQMAALRAAFTEWSANETLMSRQLSNFRVDATFEKSLEFGIYRSTSFGISRGWEIRPSRLGARTAPNPSGFRKTGGGSAPRGRPTSPDSAGCNRAPRIPPNTN